MLVYRHIHTCTHIYTYIYIYNYWWIGVAAAQFNHINDDAIIEVNAESGYFNDAKIHWEIHSKHGHVSLPYSHFNTI